MRLRLETFERCGTKQNTARAPNCSTLFLLTTSIRSLLRELLLAAAGSAAFGCRARKAIGHTETYLTTCARTRVIKVARRPIAE